MRKLACRPTRGGQMMYDQGQTIGEQILHILSLLPGAYLWWIAMASPSFSVRRGNATDFQDRYITVHHRLKKVL